MPTGEETDRQVGHLPDDAVVIRGGMMQRKDMAASARRYAQICGGTYGITVWSWPGLTAGEIALRVKETHAGGLNPVAHGRMRQSTAGKIRTVGPDGRSFGLVKTGAEGHYTLTFPSEPTDADWGRLDAMFSAAEDNPAAD
jgi:hypothetical protein